MQPTDFRYKQTFGGEYALIHSPSGAEVNLRWSEGKLLASRSSKGEKFYYYTNRSPDKVIRHAMRYLQKRNPYSIEYYLKAFGVSPVV